MSKAVKRRVFTAEDLEPAFMEWQIDGVDYILREASGDAAVKYQNAVFGAAVVRDNGKSATMGPVSDAEPIVLACCLLRPIPSKPMSHWRPAMTEGQIRALPNRVMQQMFEDLKEISPGLVPKKKEEAQAPKSNGDGQGHDDGQEDPIKNSPRDMHDATTPTSASAST